MASPPWPPAGRSAACANRGAILPNCRSRAPPSPSGRRSASGSGSDVHYARQGNLRLARDEAEVAIIRALVERQRAEGLDLEFLATNAAVRERRAGDLRGCARGLVLPERRPRRSGRDDASLCRGRKAQALRRSRRPRGRGDPRRARTRRRRRDPSEGFVPAACVIVAAGVNTPALLAELGLDLPLRVTLVHVLQTQVLPRMLDQVFGVANADCAGRQEADGRLRVTSGSLPFTGDRRPMERCRRSRQAAAEIQQPRGSSSARCCRS